MASRSRDFFRLNKRDQKDLLEILRINVSVPQALRENGCEHDDKGFERLFTKFFDRLSEANPDGR
jgi:hypothetical protein